MDRSKGRRQTKRDTKTDVGSSVISSDLKHRANDSRDGLSSYSNRRDQSGLNGSCTAMWKTNGKTTTLSLFLDSLFPKTEIPYICEMLPLELKLFSHININIHILSQVVKMTAVVNVRFYAALLHRQRLLIKHDN